MKKLLIACALIAIPFLAQATTNIDQMTTGPGTLTGNEELPFLYSGTTTSYKTTAQQIANLGSASSLPFVTIPGLVCDGSIIPLGAQTASSSQNISLVGGTQYPTTFSPAAAGDTIVLANPGQSNNSTNPTTILSSTLLSATSTAATMAANATFTSSSYQYASAFIYKTDNFTAIQNALTSAYNSYPNGANIVFPPGICGTHGPIIFYSGQRFTGSGPSGTTLALVNNSNSDLFVAQNFSAQTGNGGNGGMAGNVWEHMALYGNKAENTGSGIGSNIGTGAAIRMYGYGFDFRDVVIANFAGDGMYTEWTGENGGDPLNSLISETYSLTGPLMLTQNNGYAWNFAGPHDMNAQGITATNNGTGGVLINTTVANAQASPFNLSNSYFYQNSGYDMDCNAGCRIYSTSLEGKTVFRSGGSGVAPSFLINGSYLGTLYLGVSPCAGGGAPYKISVTNSYVATLNNAASCANGFYDNWVNSSVGAQTGSYMPSYSYGVMGGWGKSGVDTLNLLGNGSFLGQNFVSLSRGSDWPFQMTMYGNVFQMMNGTGTALGVTTSGTFLTANVSQHVLLAWISQTREVHRGRKFEKSLCSNVFSVIQGSPRCRQSVARRCSNLKRLSGGLW